MDERRFARWERGVSAGCVRIIFLVSTLRRTGPTSQLLNIVRYLDRRRFDPVVVTLSPETADSMLDSFSKLGAVIKSLSMSRIRAAVHRSWKRDIEQLLGTALDACSVIHSHGIRGDVIAAKWLTDSPRVATVRNFPYEDYVMKYGPLLGRWMARTHLQAFRALPAVVACSSTLSETLRCHGLSTTVIHNGVDTSRYNAPSPDARARLRSELGLAPGARVGVCVGALAARKDSLSVVRAVRAIDNPDLTVFFVGNGSLEAPCRREGRGDDRIRFAGQVDDVARYLRAADFFVSASRSEGLPNSVLEAIACGLHVVLSDIGPHRELLELAPSSGESFEVGNRQALMSAIERAASRDAGRVGPSPERVAELIGAERMSRQYQELYLRLAREGVAHA